MRRLNHPFCALLLFLSIAFGSSRAVAQICDQLPTFADGIAPTQEIHVDPAGSDVSGDGSPSAPYATIAFAAGLAVPGSAVVVHAGTYSGGFTLALQGTALAPIWIGGAPGESRPVIDATGSSIGVRSTEPRYLVIHDLEIRHATTVGLALDDDANYSNPLAAHHVVIRNLYIHDIGSVGNHDCLKLSGLNDFVVQGVELASCPGQAIDMVGCHRGVIADSDVQAPFGGGIQAKGGSEDIDIVRNRIAGASDRHIGIGGTTGTTFFRPPLSTVEPNFEASRIRAMANVIIDGDATVVFSGAVDSVFSNNTVIQPDVRIIRILQETTSGGGFTFLATADGQIDNNIFHFTNAEISSQSRMINIGAGVDAASFGFANNLWYASDAPGSSTPSFPSPEVDGIYGVDPLLVDLTGGDYHLSMESIAIGAGLDPARADADFEGTCYATPPSLGAFEGDPPAVPTLGELPRAMLAGLLMLAVIGLLSTSSSTWPRSVKS